MKALKQRKSKVFQIVWILLVAINVSASSSVELTQFLAGVILLNGNRTLSSEQKLQQFRKLEVITGIKAKEAVQYVEGFRSKPEEWMLIYQSITDVLEGCKNGD